ncbi:MAG TPA: electron transporter RnfG, partial [Desulfobacterales bacterium]|nr:electron transporter RnfG [Desulfobacterales bacterium]
MRDIIRMIVVLGVLAAASGVLLAGVKSGTAAKIEYQQLKFVKGPAIKKIL